ncbi:MAG: substrate-binding domain-containing protein [Actinomycetota bacterium]|nr:substrate-binding domain-containing protein [Actinomycetota bacterium]
MSGSRSPASHRPVRIRRRARRLPPDEGKGVRARGRAESGRPRSRRARAHRDFSVKGGRPAFRRLLEKAEEPPTGVVCSSDLIAIGGLQEARALGLDVPRELSIVGFDGIDADPPLTTIEQPIEETGDTTIQALRTLILEPDRSLPRVRLKGKLRAQGSTAPASE